MRLEHVAIWTEQLEELKAFYETYFGASANEKYVSDKEFKGWFSSYFLTFSSGARLEIMSLASIPKGNTAGGYEQTGLTHIAFSVETKEELDLLYERLKADGVAIASVPRVTGDGYYETCVLDPDGNRVEITVTP
ncbi:VOC family protein [Christensenellaceae bacterium OttesenSCG-928-L17]|nr:VOC family protein [Christensenellaceae bacterium OttesenSCG-928-L17]